MNDDSVAFIGGGNMSRAIVGGLLDDGFAASAITIAEPRQEQRTTLQRDFPGVVVTASNDDAVMRSAVIVLAVKPQVIADVCLALAAAVQSVRPVVISIAAGTRIADIDGWLGGGNAVVRVMPNQPALLRNGVSGIFANQATSESQLAGATRIMSAVGPVIAVGEESDIDIVTAVSGSGPAYFYLLIDMLARAGTDMGLPAESARQLAVETACGAAALAADSDEAMSVLIERVRSPGGTTAAALDTLETAGIRDIFSRALLAARDRATELADNAQNATNN